MKRKTMLTFAAGLLMVQTASATGLSYDYADGGHSWGDGDDFTSVGASKSLNEKFIVDGQLHHIDGNTNLLEALVNVRLPVNAATDFTAGIGGGFLDGEHDNNSYLAYSVGLRHALNAKIEVWAKYTQFDTDNSRRSNGLQWDDVGWSKLGLSYAISNKNMLGFEFLQVDSKGRNWNYNKVFFRHNFDK